MVMLVLVSVIVSMAFVALVTMVLAVLIVHVRRLMRMLVSVSMAAGLGVSRLHSLEPAFVNVRLDAIGAFGGDRGTVGSRSGLAPKVLHVERDAVQMLLGALAAERNQEGVQKGAHILLNDADLAVNVAWATDVRTAPAQAAILRFYANDVSHFVHGSSILVNCRRVAVQLCVELRLADHTAFQ